MRILRALTIPLLAVWALVALPGCDMFLPDAGGYGQRCLSSTENPCADGLVADTNGEQCWCMDPDGERCSSDRNCSSDRASECVDGHCKPCSGPESCEHLGFANCLLDPGPYDEAYCVGCLVPSDCLSGETCEPVSHMCQNATPCVDDSSPCTSLEAALCYAQEGVCGPCQQDSECTKFERSGRCVQGACGECRTYEDCPLNQTCTDRMCETMCTPGNDADCSSHTDTPMCNHEGFCGECRDDQDCEAYPTRPQNCLPFWGRCADCQDDSHCSEGMYCQDQRTCVECLTDEHCPTSSNCYQGQCTECTPGPTSTCATGETCLAGFCITGIRHGVPRQGTGEYPEPLANLEFGHSTAHPTMLAYGHRGEDGAVVELGANASISTVQSNLPETTNCDVASSKICTSRPLFRPQFPAGQLLLGVAESISPYAEEWTYNSFDESGNYGTSDEQSTNTMMAYSPDGQKLISVISSDNGDSSVAPRLAHHDLDTLAELSDPAPVDILPSSPRFEALHVQALAIDANGTQQATGFHAMDLDGQPNPTHQEHLVLIQDGVSVPISPCTSGGPDDCDLQTTTLAFSPAQSGPSTLLAAGGLITTDGPDYDTGWLAIFSMPLSGSPDYTRVFQEEPQMGGLTPKVVGLQFIDEQRLLVLTRDARLWLLIKATTDFASWNPVAKVDVFAYTNEMTLSEYHTGGLAADITSDTTPNGWIAVGGNDELQIFSLDQFLKEAVGFGYPCTSDADCRPGTFDTCAKPYGTDGNMICTRQCTVGDDSPCRTANVNGRCLEWNSSPLCTVEY